MPIDQQEPAGPRSTWHQALAYALLGRVHPSLGTQHRPDVAALVDDLDALFPGGRSGLDDAITRARGARERGWPRPVPPELSTGLGPAQFAAALADLRQRLGLDARPHRILSDRLPDAAEQALLRDVPPHHGGS